MCRGCDSLAASGGALGRRAFLRGGVGAAVGIAAAWRTMPTWGAPVKVANELLIHPRSDWGADLVPGPLVAETDVRFLLVHHTEGASEYSEDGAIDQMRGVYSYHTGPDKGWSDVCYNFFVDRFGRVYEARAGSLAGAVMADATGGSQGFAQLVCLLGNFMKYQPSSEMMEATAQLLAFLADRHSISTEPGATVEFTSRGSNKWPAGSTVTGRTISGHRDMSETDCPGDNVYVLLESSLPNRVRELRGGVVVPTTQPNTTDTTVGQPLVTDPPGPTLPAGPGGTFAPPPARVTPATLPSADYGPVPPATVAYSGQPIPIVLPEPVADDGGVLAQQAAATPTTRAALAAAPATNPGAAPSAPSPTARSGGELVRISSGSTTSGRSVAIAAGTTVLAAAGTVGAVAMSRRVEHLEYRPPVRPDRRDDPDRDLWGYRGRPDTDTPAARLASAQARPLDPTASRSFDPATGEVPVLPSTDTTPPSP